MRVFNLLGLSLFQPLDCDVIFGRVVLFENHFNDNYNHKFVKEK